jgi:cytochrome c oxidase subunit 3
MPDRATILAPQFDTPAQQEEAATTGMWVFIATEVLFFGGLFLAYTVCRTTYPREFAIGSHYSALLLGTINTAILLTSSLSMAFAVSAAQRGDSKWLVRYLVCTIVLGLAFLGLKGLEYSEHISEHLVPGAGFRKDLLHPVQLFFWLYFVMTGLHALHVLIGITVLSFMTFLASRRTFSKDYYTPIEITGLYWHFVDIVWVFLYPLFYLIHK